MGEGLSIMCDWDYENEQKTLRVMVSSDDFIDLSLEAQALFFHLFLRRNMENWVLCPNAIVRMLDTDESCILELIGKGFCETDEVGNITFPHFED